MVDAAEIPESSAPSPKDDYLTTPPAAAMVRDQLASPTITGGWRDLAPTILRDNLRGHYS